MNKQTKVTSISWRHVTLRDDASVSRRLKFNNSLISVGRMWRNSTSVAWWSPVNDRYMWKWHNKGSNSMKQDPSWEVRQEILRHLWNRKGCYHVQIKQLIVHILSQMNPNNTNNTPIIYTLIPLSHLRLCLRVVTSPLASQPIFCTRLSSTRAACPAHLTVLNWLSK